jgi:hypothetical protein
MSNNVGTRFVFCLGDTKALKEEISRQNPSWSKTKVKNHVAQVRGNSVAAARLEAAAFVEHEIRHGNVPVIGDSKKTGKSVMRFEKAEVKAASNKSKEAALSKEVEEQSELAVKPIEAQSPLPTQPQQITTPEQPEKSVETSAPPNDSHILNDASPVLAPFSTIEGRNWMAECLIDTKSTKTGAFHGKLLKIGDWAKLKGYMSVTKGVQREFNKVKRFFYRNKEQVAANSVAYKFKAPILLLGDGPFEALELAEFLSNYDIPAHLEHLYHIEDSSRSAWEKWSILISSIPPVVVVGNKSFASRGFLSLLMSKGARDHEYTPGCELPYWIKRIDEGNDRCCFFRSRSLETITFISQEMFLAEIFTKGNGALNFGPVWQNHIEQHPALKAVRELRKDINFLDEGFKWPKTEADPGEAALGPTDWPQVGMLKFLGYSVGVSGETRTTRQRILSDLFHKVNLPRVDSLAYVNEWGAPESSARLRKMAQSIAAFCRGAHRRDEYAMSLAIDEWEEDLAWLKTTYYDGKFDRQFQWPETTDR